MVTVYEGWAEMNTTYGRFLTQYRKPSLSWDGPPPKSITIPKMISPTIVNTFIEAERKMIRKWSIRALEGAHRTRIHIHQTSEYRESWYITLRRRRWLSIRHSEWGFLQGNETEWFSHKWRLHYIHRFVPILVFFVGNESFIDGEGRKERTIHQHCRRRQFGYKRTTWSQLIAKALWQKNWPGRATVHEYQ